MDSDPAPKTLTAAQAAVEAVCDAFGWDYRLKAGHAATFAKRLRTQLDLELDDFVAEFAQHYGRRDPGAGEWWVYREQYPCKGAGAFPSVKIVTETWGRWQLATAVQMPQSPVERMLAHIAQQEQVNGD